MNKCTIVITGASTYWSYPPDMREHVRYGPVIRPSTSPGSSCFHLSVSPSAELHQHRFPWDWAGGRVSAQNRPRSSDLWDVCWYVRVYCIHRISTLESFSLEMFVTSSTSCLKGRTQHSAGLLITGRVTGENGENKTNESKIISGSDSSLKTNWMKWNFSVFSVKGLKWKQRHPHFILGLNSEEWEVKHDQHHVDLELSPTCSVTFSLCEWFVLIWL